MSRGCKRVCLALVVVLVMFSLAAEDTVFIGDGDIGSIRMYDSQGVRLDATVDVASNIGQGWILHNPDSAILIITPKGSINLYEDSILITGDLISNNPSLYLVKGKATFTTYAMEGGTLSVSTPVSLFKLAGDGEMFVISDDTEESVTVFKGEATSYNSISRATRTIKAFEKLGMQESQAKPRAIATGYYLTYATYPDLMLAKELLSQMATTKIDTPSVPKFSSVLQKPLALQATNIQQGVTLMPAPAPNFAAVEVKGPSIPPKPYWISVTSEPIKVPHIPNSLVSTIIPQPKNRIVVTVRPMAPEAPSLLETIVEAEPEKPSIPAIPSMGITVEEVTVEKPEVVVITEDMVHPTLDEEPKVALVTETASPEVILTTEVEAKAPKQEKTQGILFTQVEEINPGSVGLEASYEFMFDGTDSNTMTHSLTIKPYVTYKSFALTLQSSVKTEDFSLFTSNIMPVPTDTLELLSYGFKFISSLRFGYSSSSFFLALDKNQYHSSFTEQYFAPRFGDNFKLGLYSRIGIGSFSTNFYFDDLYLTNLLASTSKHQYSSFFLEYAKQDGYHFSVSLGTLAKIERLPAWKVELFPNVNFLFPLIDKRTTQLGFLISASGYLPAYPSFEFDQFIDLDLTSLFPNYQVSAGFSLKQGSFSAKLLGSLRKGDKSRNLLASDLAYEINTDYSSAFDILAEAGFTGEKLEARLTVNLPFTDDFSLASVTGPSYKADFSQLTLSYKQKGFTFSFGLQEVGIVESITDIVNGTKGFTTLFGGQRSTSFLSAGYTTGALTIKAKAAYPANATVYTTPQISITASYKLGMQF